jgi:hypothetical protein
MTARRLCMGLAATSLLLVPSTATAAKKVDKKAPVVLKVSPKNAKVGDLLTVTGRNFVRGKRKNQVFFFTSNGGGTWTTAEDASATRLKVRVPEKLANLLPANGDQARIQLRVKGKRLGDRSATRVSPLISINPDSVGGDPSGSNPGVVGCAPKPSDPTSDVDQDLLTDARERDLLLDPCNRDSDGDGASDGYEYNSAIDLNSKALPYPGKRPYPNPLFADRDVDYDGDGLTVWDEYSLWTKYGQSALPLNYSDGTQKTVATAAPDPNGPLYYMDMDGDGTLSDDERDADGDLLGNWDESHGRMLPDWWKSTFNKDPHKETPYPITFAGTDMLDPDTDGDGLLDGADDQDFDGLTNAFEIERLPGWDTVYIATAFTTRRWNSATQTPADPDGTGPLTAADARYYARVQPFNPCKPVYSARCHLHPPFGYYADDEPWGGAPNPPAPGARPDDV